MAQSIVIHCNGCFDLGCPVLALPAEHIFDLLISLEEDEWKTAVDIITGQKMAIVCWRSKSMALVKMDGEHKAQKVL